MYCNNCGAVVVGKFCSCCGKRIRSELEELRSAEKRALKELQLKFQQFDAHGFPVSNLTRQHLVTACWHACDLKYRNREVWTKDDCLVLPGAYENLAEVKKHAEALCERLIKAEDF